MSEQSFIRNAMGVECSHQESSEQIPYAMCGHSMNMVQAWQTGDADELLVYGGWEWIHNSRGKVEGPLLCSKLRLLRVSGGDGPVGWTRLSISGQGPGHLANHVSTEFGVFISGALYSF